MTEQQLAAVKQALERLETWKYVYPDEWDAFDEEALVALQSIISQDALHKMAEDAREIGLTMDGWNKIGCVNHDCDECKAREQQQAAREPIKPIVDPEFDADQRLCFKYGWKSAEEAHGITAPQPVSPLSSFVRSSDEAKAEVMERVIDKAIEEQQKVMQQPAAWVGLTVEEMDEAMEFWSDSSRSAYGGAHAANEEYVNMVSTWRYIEAKLREKNAALPPMHASGLVAIKTLLNRDPCIHAKVAIEMIDEMLKEQK